MAGHCGTQDAGHYRAFVKEEGELPAAAAAGGAGNGNVGDVWMEYDDALKQPVVGGFDGLNNLVCGLGAGVAPNLRVGASTACLCLFVRVGVHAPSRELSAEALSWRTNAMLGALGWKEQQLGQGLVPPANSQTATGLGVYRPPAEGRGGAAAAAGKRRRV